MEDKDKSRSEFFKEFNRVQGAIAPLKPDSVNPHFSSKYASLQAVMGAVAPFLEAGFSFHHEGFAVDGKCFLRTIMVRGDYETVSYAPLTDDGNPQHFQSSQTYVKRGNILNLTALALDVDDDANAAVKTVTRQPVARASTPAQASQPSPVHAGGDFTRFIPSDVKFVAGKGKGANTTFSKITAPDGTTYDGNEIQGQLAESAKKSGKEIVLAFKDTSFGPKATHVKLNESQPDPEANEESVPF